MLLEFELTFSKPSRTRTTFSPTRSEGRSTTRSSVPGRASSRPPRTRSSRTRRLATSSRSSAVSSRRPALEGRLRAQLARVLRAPRQAGSSLRARAAARRSCRRRRRAGQTRTASLAMSLRNCELGMGRKRADNSLEPEVANVHHRWRWVGGAAGAALGYIIGNIPGAVAGGEYEAWRRIR